jgi:pimeloyl-ACP methyl ester carboxylesterase
MVRMGGLEAYVQGEGDAVLLIHGAHIAEAFLPLTQEAALATRHRLIRYHRRGYAGSEPIPDTFDIVDQARDARMLLEHLGVERAHVVGWSSGGVIATQLAVDAPSVVHSLIVLEPAITPPANAAAMAETLAPILETYNSLGGPMAVDHFMRELAGGPDWRAAVSRTVPGGPEQADKDASTFFEVELPGVMEWSFDRERASLIHQPVLYVMGSASGARYEAMKDNFVSLVSETEVVVLPELDHLLFIRDPKLVANTIAEFLARHPILQVGAQ